MRRATAFSRRAARIVPRAAVAFALLAAITPAQRSERLGDPLLSSPIPRGTVLASSISPDGARVVLPRRSGGGRGPGIVSAPLLFHGGQRVLYSANEAQGGPGLYASLFAHALPAD